VPKIKQDAPFFGLLLRRKQLSINVEKTLVGIHFEQYFQKLIWPPCSTRSFLQISDQVKNVLHKIPVGLQVKKLLINI
jgi:hypothetical protein